MGDSGFGAETQGIWDFAPETDCSIYGLGGYIDESGYLFTIGRSRDLIISGGLNVYPKEAEMVIHQIDGIKESAVIGVFHKDYGEGVIAAVVEDKDRCGALQAEQVISAAKKHLAGQVPNRVFFHNRLPGNVMGKIEKARLREID